MNRSTADLRQAAIDQGFASDPLTAEILAKLTELESAAVDATKALERRDITAETAPAPTKLSGLFKLSLSINALLLVFLGILVMLLLSERQRGAASKAAADLALAVKDARIEALQKSHTVEIAHTIESLQQVLNTAQSVSKSNESTAGSYQIAASLMVQEMKRLHDLSNQQKDPQNSANGASRTDHSGNSPNQPPTTAGEPH